MTRMPDPRLNLEDASLLRRRMLLLPITREADVIVVGSGPAGSAAARQIAKSGASVLVIEEGSHYTPDDFHGDGYRAMAQLWRGLGATVTKSSAPMPFLQGCAVGGTSLINGAICWRLPRTIYEHWVQDDRKLESAIPWHEIEAALDDAEAVLNVTPTDPAVAGPKNLLLAEAADKLGWKHRAMRRNTNGCRGLGRCMQGCPEGHKMSADRSLLPEACEHGAVIFSRARVDAIQHENQRATGVRGTTMAGIPFLAKARRAVVLAASAVQTPALLIKSGITHGPVGENLQGHPGAAMRGKFHESIRVWSGATQGHELTEFAHEGIKLDVLGMDLGLAASRHKGFGKAFMHELADLANWAHWGAAVEAEAKGKIRPGLGKGNVNIFYTPTRNDMLKIRRGLVIAGEALFAAGAEYVEPGVAGWPQKIHSLDDLHRFGREAPVSPGNYAMIVSHIFGTTRMGSEPDRSVVRHDFRHHAIDRLYVADSGVFPTNTGVNPMLSIVALATLCGKRVAAAN